MGSKMEVELRILQEKSAQYTMLSVCILTSLKCSFFIYSCKKYEYESFDLAINLILPDDHHREYASQC